MRLNVITILLCTFSYTGFSQNNSIGFGMGYGGGDGRSPSYTYDIEIAKKIYQSLELKVEYLKGDLRTKISDIHYFDPEILKVIQEKYTSSYNTSKNPVGLTTNFEAYSAGLYYPINKYKYAEVRVFGGISYYKEESISIVSINSNPDPGDYYITYNSYTSKGIGLNVALGFRQNFRKQYYAYIDTYFITGAFQVGFIGGLRS